MNIIRSMDDFQPDALEGARAPRAAMPTDLYGPQDNSGEYHS
jgi:hypothetical protein